MIPIRLPWRHRARPSATLHEIQSAPKGKLVLIMLHSPAGFVNQQFRSWKTWPRLLSTAVAERHFPGQFPSRDSQSLYQNQRQRPVEAGGESGKSFHDFTQFVRIYFVDFDLFILR